MSVLSRKWASVDAGTVPHIVTNEVGLGRFGAASSGVDWWEHPDKSASKILKEGGVDNV